jgi:3-oxoadipate enol-lactonase
VTDLNWFRQGSGEPVLLIMGLATSSRGWRRLAPAIAEEHEAILFDNRGTGKSPRVTGPSTMEALTEDALSVLDAAGHESAHVMGASMGGMIAQHLALDHPERVRSLVLSATSPGGLLAKPPWRMLAATALRPLLGAKRTWPLLAPMIYAERTRLGAPGRVHEDLRIRAEHATDPRTTVAQMTAIARHDTRRRLGELAGLPVTVVHGDLDQLVPPSHGRALVEGIPGAHHVVLEGAGHVLTTDDEFGVAEAVREHLHRAGDTERSLAR